MVRVLFFRPVYSNVHSRDHTANAGTSVKVFGTLTVPTVVGSTVTSTYTIDNDGTTPFSSASVPSAVIEEIDGQLFFDSGTLTDDTHVLMINVTSASDGAPYLLDYIKYAATRIPDSTSSPASPSETGAAIATSPASKNNVGPIVGGVVGGVVGLILIGIGVFLFFRYFRHRLSLSGRQRGGRGEFCHAFLFPETRQGKPHTSHAQTSSKTWRKTPNQIPPRPPLHSSPHSSPAPPVLPPRHTRHPRSYQTTLRHRSLGVSTPPSSPDNTRRAPHCTRFQLRVQVAVGKTGDQRGHGGRTGSSPSRLQSPRSQNRKPCSTRTRGYASGMAHYFLRLVCLLQTWRSGLPTTIPRREAWSFEISRSGKYNM